MLPISGAAIGVEDGQTATVTLNTFAYAATLAGDAWTLSVPADDLAFAIRTDGIFPGTAMVSDLADNPAPMATQALTVEPTLTGTAEAGSIIELAIDSIAPAEPTIPLLAPESDSGVAGDGITNVATPTFTGTAALGSTVILTDTSDGTELGTVLVDENGAWSVTSSPLADGFHSIVATATDAAGNLSPASGAIELTVDSMVPAEPTIPLLAPESDSGVAGDGITNVAMPTLTGTAEAGSTVILTDTSDGTELGTALADENGAWSITSSFLADGLPGIAATATDAADNLSPASGAIELAIDSIVPAEPTIPLLAPESDSGVAGDGITGDTKPTLTGTVEAGSTVILTDTSDGTELGTAVADESGAWSITSSPLADGLHSIVATATDAAGNLSPASGAIELAIDSIAPAEPTIPLLAPESDSGVAGDGITGDTKPTLTGTAEAGSTVILTDTSDGTELGTALADESGAWSITSSPLADGFHAVAAIATDAAGNLSPASGAIELTIDSIVPAEPTIPLLAPESDSGVAGDGITSDATPTLTGTAGAGSTIILTDTGDGTELGTAVADESGAWSITSSPLADGFHSIAATASNVANFSPASDPIGLTIDSIVPAEPTIPLLAPESDSGVAADGITSNTTPILTGTAEAGSTVAVFDGASLLGTTLAEGDGQWGFTPATALAEGGHSITATATDAAGNVSAASSALALTIEAASSKVQVVSVTATPSGTLLGTGDTVTFMLTVDAPVQVTAAADGSAPALALSNGALASYVGTSADGTALTFGYTVAAGDDTADLQVTGLDLNGATVGSPGSGSTFYEQDEYGAGQGPTSVATADVNGDGNVDLVTANTNSSTASVLLGDGLGGFRAKTDFETGSNPFSVAVADVNGDGNADLVTANYTSSTASVLLGDGLGDFGAKTDFATGRDPQSVAVADVSRDGKADVVTANNRDSTASVLLGNGLGGFGAKTDFATGRNPGSIAATDVNGDGNADLVTANTNSSTASVLLGNGLGGFNAKTDFAVGSNPYSVAVVDLNGDGNADLVTANLGSSTASVLLGDGLGGFGAKTDFATGRNPIFIAATDMNGDGKADLVVANYRSSTASVLLGDGLGGFGARMDFATGRTPYSVAMADLNGDGNADLVTSNYDGSTVSVLLGVADPSLEASGLAGLAGSDTGLAIDTIAPAEPGTPVLLTASDSGALDDAVTSNTTPTLTGTAEAGSTVILTDTGDGTELGTALVNENGAWSITSPFLADGLHGIAATATDAAGNLSPASGAIELTIDSIVPAEPTIPLLVPESDSGVAGDGITSDTTPTLTGTAEAGSTVTLTDGAAVLVTVQANSAGLWSVTSINALAEGAHSLTATSTDAAGNASPASAALALTLDTIAAVVTEALARDTGGSATDRVTADPTLTGSGDPGAIVVLTEGGTTLGMVTAAASGVWSFTPTLADGAHTVVARETDAAGNTGSATTSFTLDTLAPAAPSGLALAAASDSGAPGDDVTNMSRPMVTGKGVPGDTVILFDSLTPIGFATVGEVGTWLVAPTADLSDGPHTLTTTQTDAAGNVSPASAALVLTVDTAVLAFTTGSQIPNDDTPTISGRATPSSTVALLANGVAVGSAIADATTGLFEVTADTPLPLGLNSLTATQTTASGTSAPSAPITVFVMQAPEAGISTTDFSSADIGGVLGLGVRFAFIGGTEAVLLTDSTLSVGTNTNQATIQRLYEGLLGRGNDTGGITFWDDQINDGASEAAVATGFLNSPEYVATHPVQTDEQFVTSLYQGLLGRAPEQEGLTFWTEMLAQGSTQGSIVIGIADSDEAKSHLALTTAQVYVPNDAGTLTHVLYETGLRREVELPALAYWKAAYEVLTPLQLTALIASSPEFTAYHAGQDNDAYVNSLYQAGLGRPAEATGMASWVNLLNSGETSRTDILLAVATSGEAKAHLTYNLSG